MHRLIQATSALLILMASHTAVCAYEGKTTASYSLSYDSRFKDSHESPFVQKFYLKHTNSYKLNRDFSIVYTLKFEQERHGLLDYDSSMYTPEFTLDFNFKRKGKFKTFSFSDQVVNVINTTDVFNQYTNKTRYDMKFKTDGVLSYENSYKNLNLSVAYGTPKVEKDPYEKTQQNTFMVQKTFASSIGYTYPVFNSGFNLHSAASYSKYPNMTTSNHTSKVESYAHFATALTYGEKDDKNYFALMHNKRNVTMTQMKDTDYYIQGTEFIYAHSFSDSIKFKSGYERFLIKNQQDMSSHVSVLPVEMLYNVNDQFKVWAQARFSFDDSFTDHKSFKTFNKEFTGYDENSYTIGSEYKF